MQCNSELSIWKLASRFFIVLLFVSTITVIGWSRSVQWQQTYSVQPKDDGIRSFHFRQTVTGTNSSFTVIEHFRLCTQSERIEHMKNVCARHREARTKDLMTVRDRSLVDMKHKVMMCWMSKSGCTSLKALFLEAAGFNVSEKKLGHNMMQVHSPSVLQKYGLIQFRDLPPNVPDLVTDDYFRFFVIRHPFERLLSTYRGKVLDPGSDFPWFAAGALKMANPELFERNKTLAAMAAPQKALGPPSFSDFLRWIWKSRTYNDHWSQIVEACHPCALNWSAIFRLETMEHDSGLLLEQLKPDLNVSKVPVRHSHKSTPTHDRDVVYIPEYEDVDDKIVDHFLEMYALDMEMFGYRWDKATKTASCRIQTENGPCC